MTGAIDDPNIDRPVASQKDPTPISLNHEFHATVARFRDRVAFERSAPDQPDQTTYQEVYDLAKAFAAGLLDLGLSPGTRVALVADNRLNWYVADRGILMSGGIDVPQPRDIGGNTLLRILRHSGCRFAVVEGIGNRRRIQAWAAAGKLPRLLHLIRFFEEGEATDGPVPELGFEALLDRGRTRLRSSPESVETAAFRCRTDSPATIVYTSGTTGSPKGVVLTHANILHNIRVLPYALDLEPGVRYLSILPAWHMFERTIEYLMFNCGGTLIYTSRRRIKSDLRDARPALVAVVPRILEMIYQDIMKKLSAAPPLRRALARLAFSLARTRSRALRRLKGISDDTAGGRALHRRLLGLAVSALLAPPHVVLDRLVLARIRQALGPTLRTTISGGGALPVHIDEFLNAIGMTTLVGYGLTETAPVVSVRTLRKNPIGTIGLPLPETEVSIRDPEGNPVPAQSTGLVHIRGPQVMRGYFRDHALTRRVLSSGGWFNSGDLGSVRADGEIRITGRAKDTIVLLSGENVEPIPLESRILQSPFILQVMIVGQDRKDLGALVVPDGDVLAGYTRTRSIPGNRLEDWIEDPSVLDLLKSEVRSRTSPAEGFNPFETVKRIHILSAPFSIEDGSLTHTMKLRRNVVMQRYADVIRGM